MALEKISQEQIEIAHAAGEAERLAIAKTRQQLEAGDVKDASTAGRNLGGHKGIALDQALEQRGEPTVVHERRQAEDIVKRLKRLAPKAFSAVEGEAQEMRVPELPKTA